MKYGRLNLAIEVDYMKMFGEMKESSLQDLLKYSNSNDLSGIIAYHFEKLAQDVKKVLDNKYVYYSMNASFEDYPEPPKQEENMESVEAEPQSEDVYTEIEIDNTALEFISDSIQEVLISKSNLSVEKLIINKGFANVLFKGSYGFLYNEGNNEIIGHAVELTSSENSPSLTIVFKNSADDRFSFDFYY